MSHTSPDSSLICFSDTDTERRDWVFSSLHHSTGHLHLKLLYFIRFFYLTFILTRTIPTEIQNLFFFFFFPFIFIFLQGESRPRWPHKGNKNIFMKKQATDLKLSSNYVNVQKQDKCLSSPIVLNPIFVILQSLQHLCNSHQDKDPKTSPETVRVTF